MTRLVGNPVKQVVGSPAKLPVRVSSAAAASSEPTLAGASYDSVSLDISGIDTFIEAMFIGNSGADLFIATANQQVRRITMSTPWLISSGTLTSSKNVATPCADPHGVWFKSDGTIMVTTNDASNNIHKWDLSTAWDVTTATYDTGNVFVATAYDSLPRGTIFNPEGTVAFYCGRSADQVHQFNLGTAWDLTSITFDSSLVIDPDPGLEDIQDIFVSQSGLTMFVLDDTTDKIFEYNLSVAWDLSTATYSGYSLDTTPETTAPKAIFVSDDGLKLYVGDDTDDRIYQYSL